MSGHDAKDFLQQELDGVTNILKATPFDEVLKICNTYVRGVDECISTLNLVQAEKSELKQQLDNCRRHVSKLKTSATGLKSSVERLHEYAVLDDTRVQEKMRCIQRGELKPVKEYVELVKEYSSKTVQCFKSFQTLYDETLKISSELERSIEVQEARAKNKKTKYLAMKIVAVGAMGATCVMAAASVMIVDVFTFGVETIVCASLIAATVLTLGVATGVVTHKAGNKLEELAKGLREMLKEMNVIQKDIIRLGDIVNNIESSLNHIEENRSMLERALKMKVSTGNMMRVLHNSKRGIDSVFTEEKVIIIEELGPTTTEEKTAPITEEWTGISGMPGGIMFPVDTFI